MATKSKKKDDHGEGEFRGSDEWGTALIDGASFRSKPLVYSVVGDEALFEGDIILGKAKELAKDAEARRTAAVDGVQFGVAITGQTFRWPNNTVPFVVASNLPNKQRVTDAVAEWQTKTNLNFVQRTSEADFIRFVPSSGCSSFVGKQGGQQNINLGSNCTTGNCIHEIGHAIGLWHEQSREDRDSFVTVMFQNIIPTRVNNFNQHIADGDDIGPYDYGSIMHYPRKAFTANGQDTIVPVQAGVQIGQRNALSAGDIAAANALYPPIVKAKFSDDPVKAKFSDDPVKAKFSDDPKIKAADDPKFKFFDDPQKFKFFDDIRFPFDQPGSAAAPAAAPAATAGDVEARIQALEAAIQQLHGQNAALAQELQQILNVLRQGGGG